MWRPSPDSNLLERGAISKNTMHANRNCTKRNWRGAPGWLIQLQHTTLDLRVVALSPTLDVEITEINLKKKKEENYGIHIYNENTIQP